MNVFEDLIEELKEANLLEETIMEMGRPHSTASAGEADGSAPDSEEASFDFAKIGEPAGEHDGADPAHKELEYYRKRAMAEVSSLQMVEHVLSGVEREHMKMSPVPFDDLGVKKALHRFLQISSEPGHDEFPDAEYNLMHETQEWAEALSRRDAHISVANIRRFCENSKPALSSQALIALARFYRNSPFSEAVRGKFDFVMTRLFSRDLGDETRKPLFNRLEANGHIRTLYTNWSSLDLHADQQQAGQIVAAVEGFDGFASEVAEAEDFNALVSSDFFNRVRAFKEATEELFFASDVTGAAIECNIKIGNRFVELLRAEGEKAPHNSVEAKYGFSHDTLMSTAASKTLHLLEILKDEPFEEDERHEQPVEEPVQKTRRPAVEFERAPRQEAAAGKIFGINKWVLIVCIILLAIGFGVYAWSSSADGMNGEIVQATDVAVTDPDLKPHLKGARTSAETLYGIAAPSWETKPQDEQKELLKKAYAMARSLQMKRVNVLNGKGRTIGYATADKAEVFAP